MTRYTIFTTAIAAVAFFPNVSKAQGPIATATNSYADLADLALAAPVNGTVEIAGPERYRLDELATEVLTALEDSRQVEADPEAPYFGARLDDESLLPGPAPRIATTRFHDWLSASLQAPPVARPTTRRQG